MRRETSAGGVVARSGRLLLVQVLNLAGEIVWTFPKGHLEPGETAAQAAVREVREETGWTCRITGTLPAARYRFRRAGRLVDKRVGWFRMAAVARTGRRDPEEIRAVRWAGVRTAAALLRYPSDLKLLEVVRAAGGRR